MRKYIKELKKTKPSVSDKHGRRKEQKRIDTKRQHLKILVRYIDKDYDSVKNRWVPHPLCHETALFTLLACIPCSKTA